MEKSEDIQTTIDYEYEYETQDSTLADNLDASDCDLISKIEIEEDLVIKTESSDLSEFIEQCHKEDISKEIRWTRWRAFESSHYRRVLSTV